MSPSTRADGADSSAAARWRQLLPRLLVGLLCLVYVLIQYVAYQSTFVFEVAHDLHLTYARLLIEEGLFTFDGPNIGPFQYHLGPLYYLLLSVPMLVSLDPYWVWLVFVLTGAGALWLFNEALCRVARWPVALTITVGLAGSLFFYESGRQLWHSSLLPICITGFLYTSARLFEDGRMRWAIGAAVLVGVAVQLHFQAWILGGALLLALSCRLAAWGGAGSQPRALLSWW